MDIQTNEMMCAAEIIAASVQAHIRESSMHAANRAREEQDHAHAYGEEAFRDEADELDQKVIEIRTRWLGK